MPNQIDLTFILNCQSSIQMMRRAGMNEIQIACIITEIRSHSLNEEFRRLQELIRLSPPKHHPHGVFEDEIKNSQIV